MTDREPTLMEAYDNLRQALHRAFIVPFLPLTMCVRNILTRWIKKAGE